MATDDGNAYYDIVSRLKVTHLRFSSISPNEPVDPRRDLVITSLKEVASFEGGAIAVEELQRDPLIMEGQLLPLLLESKRELLIGIDPGSRLGLAMFYGGREFGTTTTNSAERLVEVVAAAAAHVPHTSLSVKIGGGQPRSSLRLAGLLRERLPAGSLIEIVDESGTSSGRRGAIGSARDQRAAARIAHRKGVRVSDFAWPTPRRRLG